VASNWEDAETSARTSTVRSIRWPRPHGAVTRYASAADKRVVSPRVARCQVIRGSLRGESRIDVHARRDACERTRRCQGVLPDVARNRLAKHSCRSETFGHPQGKLRRHQQVIFARRCQIAVTPLPDVAREPPTAVARPRPTVTSGLPANAPTGTPLAMVCRRRLEHSVHLRTTAARGYLVPCRQLGP
jgi:hypothetical protein